MLRRAQVSRLKGLNAATIVICCMLWGMLWWRDCSRVLCCGGESNKTFLWGRRGGDIAIVIVVWLPLTSIIDNRVCLSHNCTQISSRNVAFLGGEGSPFVGAIFALNTNPFKPLSIYRSVMSGDVKRCLFGCRTCNCRPFRSAVVLSSATLLTHWSANNHTSLLNRQQHFITDNISFYL